MERLTRYIGSRAATVGDMGSLRELRAVIDRLAAYEDTGLTPEECAEFVHEGLPAALDKLAAYESTGVQPEEVLILAGIKYLAQRLTDDEQKILDKILSDAQRRDIGAIDRGKKKKAT